MTEPECYLSSRVGRAVVACLTCVLLSGSLATPLRAAIVYSALEDGLWRVYHQEGLDTQPIALGVGRTDGAAPRLSADRKYVALERVARGIEVCALDGTLACTLLNSKGEPPVRATWYAQENELVFVKYTLTADDERSELKRTRDGRRKVAPLLRMTGIQDYPDVSRDGRQRFHCIVVVSKSSSTCG